MAKTTQETNRIIGMKKDIVDDNTGAPAGYHVIHELQLNAQNGYCTVTLGSYYNQQLQQAGKHAMGSAVVTLHGVPPRGEDVLDWAYRSIAAPVSPDAVDAFGGPVQAHLFTGAVLVTDSPAETST